jgi:hypothetical protein
VLRRSLRGGRPGVPVAFIAPRPSRGIHWAARRKAITDAESNDVFDRAFLTELEGIVADSGMAASAAAPAPTLDRAFQEALDAFRRGPGAEALTEEQFLGLSAPQLAERCNGLVEGSRKSPRREAAQAVESFVVFFQALVPTLGEAPSREVKGTFFRLAPTLLQIAWDDFGERADRREDGRQALRQLESLLLEVASVRLAPAESDLLFRSLDQLATLIASGEYALARDLVANPLLAILRKNRVARSLFRLMEVEVAIQGYLKEKLGYASPQLRLPDDGAALSEFGPVRVFDETDLDGRTRRYLQLQLPDIPILSDIVVHFAPEGGAERRDARLDGLGTVELDLPPGLYRIGLGYEPES